MSNGENRNVRGGLGYNKKEGDPRSDNVSNPMQNSFIGRLNPNNLTDEERDMLNLYGDQLVDSTQTPADILDNTEGNTMLYMNLIWQY